MTTDEIKAEIEEVRRLSGDAEAAGIVERRLWRAVLENIAAGGVAPTLKASLALQTLTVDFPRLFS